MFLYQGKLNNKTFKEINNNVCIQIIKPYTELQHLGNVRHIYL